MLCSKKACSLLAAAAQEMLQRQPSQGQPWQRSRVDDIAKRSLNSTSLCCTCAGHVKCTLDAVSVGQQGCAAGQPAQPGSHGQLWPALTTAFGSTQQQFTTLRDSVWRPTGALCGHPFCGHPWTLRLYILRRPNLVHLAPPLPPPSHSSSPGRAGEKREREADTARLGACV